LDNKSINLASYEVITENENGALVGGFSNAFTQATATLAAAGDNTVAGCETNICPVINKGNCVAGCGGKQ
jgi:hypothetical protein